MSERYLDGRTAWVTGGASGIGRACALALAQAGANVAIGSLIVTEGTALEVDDFHPSAAALDEAKAAIESCGVRVLAEPLDVRSDASVELFLRRIGETLGPVDVLVNAAGTGETMDLVDHRDAVWHGTLDVNLSGPYRTIKRCLPGMIERRWGRIVNIASTAASVGSPGMAAYCASKAGLLGLTRCAALEGAPHGVTCNAISPGQVDTGSTRHSFAKSDPAVSLEAYKAVWAVDNPQKRMIEAREIAAVAAFLCRDEAFGVTAENISVTGGTAW